MSTVSPPYTKKKLGANFKKKNSEKSAEQIRETGGTIGFDQHPAHTELKKNLNLCFKKSVSKLMTSLSEYFEFSAAKRCIPETFRIVSFERAWC